MSTTMNLVASENHFGRNGTRSSSIVSEGGEEWLNAVPGEVVRIRIHSKSVSGHYSILEALAQPMAGTPLHTHCEDEVFNILEGVMTFQVGDERFEAKPGAVVVVAAGVPHAWRNFGDTTVRSMVTFTPGGIEGLFLQIAHLSPQQLVELLAQHGRAIVGPPIDR